MSTAHPFRGLAAVERSRLGAVKSVTTARGKPFELQRRVDRAVLALLFNLRNFSFKLKIEQTINQNYV